MTFDQYLRRPVYKAQVYTCNVAKQLLGMPGGDIATTTQHPIMLLRLLPAHRCAASLRLRKAVADLVRQKRQDFTFNLEH